jgi:putative ABC transport system permease protein
MILLDERPMGSVLVKVSTEDVPETLRHLQQAWQQVEPAETYSFSFLDERYDQLYRSERRVNRLFVIAAALAVFVSCLGLFGLAAFTAERRTKEIGIRKVLGASTYGLVALLSSEFVRLVALAFAVAAPVAYLVMERWLSGFAYRGDLGFGVFAAAGVVALLVALLTVSGQAVRAALADPVESLRYE